MTVVITVHHRDSEVTNGDAGRFPSGPLKRQAFHLATLRSSAKTQMANERRATEPDWWVAARGVGTYSNSVLIPRAT